jgi:hypothetical protein
MKTLITTGILTVSLALVGTTAMAAPSPANPLPRYAQTSTQVRQARAPLRVAARRPVFPGRLNVDVAQFVRGMLGGGPIPYANLVRDVRGMSGSGGGTYDWSSSPSYDSSAPAGCASCDAQAASDAENQAIQQMNDTNALNASMAAAEQQNDAANAATLQTEINAGM